MTAPAPSTIVLRVSPAAIIVGAALWFTHGSLDLFSGPGGSTRVAMLPSWLELVALVAASLMLGAGLVVYARRGPSRASPALFDPVDAVQPLLALVVLAFPYLPLLPDWMPILRVLAGPAKYLVWIVVGAQVAWIAIDRRGSSVPGLNAWLILGVAAAIFGASAWRLSESVIFPGGDEPHYLVMAQSLWRDGDLKIENNHARRDYAEYYGTPLEPHYQTRGADGEIYSIHPVGLPVLVAPVYAAGGYRGVVLFLVVLGALTSALAWSWARTLSGSAEVATFGWAAVALSAPFLFGSFIVYPEMAAALCVIVAFVSARPEAALARWVCGAIAIGALPWLSTKYAPMALALVGVCCWRAWIDPRRRAVRAAAIVVTFGMSLVLWFAFFYLIWGSPLPTSPYAATEEQMQLGFLALGAPGLLFDQEYGVIAYAPVLFLGFTGLVTMWRSGGELRRASIEIALVFVALLCTVGAYHVWWGGSATPGRPLVSGLPLLAGPIAWQYVRSREPIRRAAHRLLLVVSLVVTGTLVLAQNGFLVALGRSGKSPLLEWWSPEWRLWALAPSFIYHGVLTAAAFTTVWLVAALAMQLVFGMGRRLSPGRAALSATAAASAAVVAVSLIVPIVFAARLQPDVTLDARGRVTMLDHFDRGTRPVALVYDPLRRIESNTVPSLFSLSATPGLRLARQPVPLLFNARFALPAGRYAAELRPAAPDSAEASGELALQVGRIGDPLVRWQVQLGPSRSWKGEFSLPIDASFVGFRAAPSIAEAAGELRVRPLAVVDARRRVDVDQVLGAATYGQATVYFHDENVWPEREGLWTRGASAVPLTMVSTGASRVKVNVRSGARANRVTLDAGGWRREIDLQPGMTREVELPGDGRGGVIALRVTSASGFTPADTTPGSTDRRFLGCWIEVVQ